MVHDNLQEYQHPHPQVNQWEAFFKASVAGFRGKVDGN